MVQPADFYTGIIAELYDQLKSVRPNPAEYARLVETYGEPALELGCGDGDPLLALRRHGLDVEGVDSSPDMLDLCRSNAASFGLEIVLHEQRMEDLDVARRYQLIFLAGPTFLLLTDDKVAFRALARIREHLAISGAVMRVRVIGEDRDAAARTQTAILRYERHVNGVQSIVERPWTLHWYTPEIFQNLAAAAGLSAVFTDDTTGKVATAGSTDFTALLHPV